MITRDMWKNLVFAQKHKSAKSGMLLPYSGAADADREMAK